MLFRDITILDENLEVQEHMYVGTKDKRIAYIGKAMPQEDYGTVYEGTGRLLMPGFYNIHAHSPMALMRGYGENLKLQDWLNTRIFPFEAKLDSDAVYWGTLLCMAESLRFGIVSTSDMYYFVPDIAHAVIDSGAKNNISRSLTNFDGTPFDQMESAKELEEAFHSLNGAADGRVVIEASLHAEYTSDEATARSLADWCMENGARMHVHVSETKTEHEECKQRHNGKTPVQYLNDCGIFNVPSIAAHCVWIEGEDYDILKEKNVTVATNPCSNLKLASGICNSAEILKRGINLGIGTDSVASNNSLNFLEEMKTLAMIGKVRAEDPTVVTPKQVLYAATRAGALAQGRSDCGIMKEGARADLIVLRTDVPNMHPVHDLINNIVYSASGSDVLLTMVDGKVLYQDGDYTSIDLDETIERTERAVDRILSQL